MSTMIPFTDADFASVEGACAVVRASFGSIVDDPSDALVIASSRGTIALVTGVRGIASDVLLGHVRAIQVDAGERAILAAGWPDADEPGVMRFWLGTDPSTVHAFNF